jgi:hypothetical protein
MADNVKIPALSWTIGLTLFLPGDVKDAFETSQVKTIELLFLVGCSIHK